MLRRTFLWVAASLCLSCAASDTDDDIRVDTADSGQGDGDALSDDDVPATDEIDVAGPEPCVGYTDKEGHYCGGDYDTCQPPDTRHYCFYLCEVDADCRHLSDEHYCGLASLFQGSDGSGCYRVEGSLVCVGPDDYGCRP